MKLKKKSRAKVAVLSSFFALLAMLGTAVTCPFSGGEAALAADSAVLSLDFLLRTNPAQMLNIDFWLSPTAVSYLKTLSIDFFYQNGNANYAMMFKLLGIDFLLNPTMMIEMDPLSRSVTANVTPTQSGNVGRESTSFVVKTTDVNGYAVYLQQKGTNGTALKLGTTDSIPTMTSSATAKEYIPVGQWGYNFSMSGVSLGTGGAWSVNGAANNSTNNTTYRGINNSAGAKVTTNGGATLTLDYAAKIGYDKTPGAYSNTFAVVSVVGANSPATLSAAYQAVDNFVEAALMERPDLRAEVEERKAQARANKFEIANDLMYEVTEDQE